MSDSCAPARAREISLGSWKSKKRRNVSLGGFVKLTGIPYRTLVKLIGIALAAVYYHDTCEAIEFLEGVWDLVLPLNKKSQEICGRNLYEEYRFEGKSQETNKQTTVTTATTKTK